MSAVRSIKDGFSKMPLSKKIQVILALIVTVVLLISAPVYAWFNYRRRVIKLQEIEAPNVLFISAAHREASAHFEMNGINADEILVDGEGHAILDENDNGQKITHKYYVFNVTGDAVDKFTIQLAYTTNNPLKYEVYAAKELTSQPAYTAGEEIDYVVYHPTNDVVTNVPELDAEKYNTDFNGDALYYQIDINCGESQGVDASGKYTGTFLNSSDGAKAYADANNEYLDDSYGDYNVIEPDAKPVYWQASGVSAFPGETNSNKLPFSRHFILKVSWEPDTLKNSDKETDIVYISVKATS